MSLCTKYASFWLGGFYNTWMRATRRIWTMGELGYLDHLQWVPPCAPRKWRHKSLCGFIFLIPRIWGQYEVPNPAKSISSSITGREIRPSANWTLDSCVVALTIQPCTQTRPRFRVEGKSGQLLIFISLFH